MSGTSHIWYSASQLAAMALPGMPGTARGVQIRAESENWLAPELEGQTWRRRQGRGGGFEFTPYALPLSARVKLAVANAPAQAETFVEKREREDLWRRYEGMPEALRRKAQKALEVINAVETLVASGTRKTHAVMMVAHETGVGKTTINNWYRDLRGLNRCDWLPALAPHWGGGGNAAECTPEAWEMLKSDWLRVEQPNFTDCYRRVKAAAVEHGWKVPSAKTLLRRLQAFPPELVVLAREGVDALKRLYPAQQRRRDVFHALQAVNADGHRWDVFVKWEDGTIGRPVMVGFQDLFSGMILSWRIDKSENAETVRLAFGDMVETYGIPKMCYLDNGRNFASKWMTGGIPNRFRFKVKEDEPVGIMTQLGVEVHWTTPYSGQSKPIERAWRDLAQGAAKHPKFAGAWTGNNPMAKPENYASKAVPIEVFVETIAAEIREHNARTGRRSAVCGGKLSFMEAFKASYEASPIVKATAEQRRLWLMAAEAIKPNRISGEITLEGNRFWAEELMALRGQPCVVRFDPQALQEPLHVYRADGTFVVSAPCIAAVGFSDKMAAQEHGRARRKFVKAAKEQLEATKTLSLKELAALSAPMLEDDPEPLDAKIVTPFQPATRFHGNAALAPEPMRFEDEDEDQDAIEAAKILSFIRG
ncbi:transposase domain-containing protein [Gluconobacter frateurii]|uniref:Transposase n=1 Tax=Gluconobacter frateurii NRIC 0228 TaxID=1307946 RepID=A0ABQ0Q8Y1_9PROT|nr:transposase domain-containing protein [Gluconobacter frateurii]GBR09410.1 transposase [Gluconobacter frateurii NRIC 0228]GLP91971.1 transposase [Gluconobacter frateurii]